MTSIQILKLKLAKIKVLLQNYYVRTTKADKETRLLGMVVFGSLRAFSPALG